MFNSVTAPNPPVLACEIPRRQGAGGEERCSPSLAQWGSFIHSAPQKGSRGESGQSRSRGAVWTQLLFPWFASWEWRSREYGSWNLLLLLLLAFLCQEVQWKWLAHLTSWNKALLYTSLVSLWWFYFWWCCWLPPSIRSLGFQWSKLEESEFLSVQCVWGDGEGTSMLQHPNPLVLEGFEVIGCIWSQFSATAQSGLVDEEMLCGALRKCCVG